MDNQNLTPNPTPPTENISAQNPPVQEPPSSQVYTAPQSSTPPPSPKSFLSSKIVLLIVILLILLGLGGTYLALKSKPKPQPVVQNKPTPTSAPTPTPADETANWKTYTSKNLKYSFKYPEKLDLELIFVSETDEGAVTLSNIKETPISNQQIPRYISIHLVKDSNNVSVDNYINSEIEKKKDLKQIEGNQEYTLRERPDKLKSIIDNIKREQIIISGVTGERVTGLYLPSMANTLSILLPYNKKLYEMRLDPYLGKDDRWFVIFNQILSTFQFSN